MAEAIGPTLSKYRILEKLSTGGMGVVYLAEDTTLHRKVALKVLTQDWSSESDRLARFRFEAQALATLNHPNIVTIYSVEEEDGVHFLTMELVEGKTLAELIPSVGFQVERLFDLAIPLADALSAAHARGIIHRDLKPGNVMVNREGRVKILDFGLAKQREDVGEPIAGAARQPLTRDGQLLGTVPYMSPEQIQGDPADHRSDIFSLGIILYEMATGSRPFDGKSWTDLASAILRDTPPSVTTLNIYLPRHLGRIIRHCLEKDPQRRFQTALDLRNELEELQKEVLSGVFAVPSTHPETSSASLKRPPPQPPRPRDNEKFLAVLATLLVVAVLGTVAWLRTTRSSDGPGRDAPIVRPAAEEGKRIVVLPLENLGPPDHEYFTAGITEEITTRLSSVSALHVISRTTARNYERTAKSAQEIGRELGVDYLLEGSVRWSSGGGEASQVRVTPQLIRVADDTHVWSQSYDRVLTDIFTVQSEIAEEVIHQLGIALREPEQAALAVRPTRHLEAYQSYLRGMEYAGRREPSEENLQQAAQMFERATELDRGFALAWAELSEVHSQIYHFTTDRTEERLERARAAADRALELAPDLPASHRALGYYHYWGHGDYEAALREFDLAARSLPNDSQLLEGIAYIRRRQGRFTEAITGLREALTLDPQSSRLASELAQTYMTTRQYELADRYYDAAIALSPNEAAPYQLKAWNLLLWRSAVAEARATLAVMPRPEELSATMAWLRQELVEGRYEAALARIEAAPVQLIGTDAGVFPRTLLRGQVFELLDRRAEARQSYLGARVVMERLAKVRPDDPRVHGSLALAYAGLDRKEDAVREGQLAVAQAPISEDAIKGPAFLEQLAAVYAAVGEQEQAIDLLEQLLAMPSNISVAMLRIDPQWRPLEDHPRFLRLVASSTGAAG